MTATSTRRTALKLTGGALAYATGAGAFALATTATSSCTAKAADRSAWDRAYAEYERTKAAYEADNGSDYDLHDKLCEAFCAAEDALIQMPAPHVAALAWKLDKLLVIERDGFTASWSADYVAAAKADAHRLAQMEG